VIRRNFIDAWLYAFADVDERFDFDAQNAARRVVEGFSTTSLLKQPSNSLRNVKKLRINCTPN